MTKELFLKGTINAETVLSGQINVECTLIGKLTQGKVVVIPSADLNRFLEQITADVYTKQEVDEKLKSLSDNNNSEADKFFAWLKERNYNLKNFKGLEKTFPVLTFRTPEFKPPKVGEMIISGTCSPNTVVEFNGEKQEVYDNGTWVFSVQKPFENGVTYTLNYYDYANRLHAQHFTTEIEDTSKGSTIPPEDNVTVVTYDIVDKYELTGDVTLPPSVIKIDKDAFYDSKDINSVTAAAVTEIGESAFINCENLTHISMPRLETIKDTAFQNCTNLKTVDTPSLYDWGRSVFSGCDALETLIVNDKTDKWNFKYNYSKINYNASIYNQDKSKKFNRETEQWESV